jgi:hypothetical protein
VIVPSPSKVTRFSRVEDGYNGQTVCCRVGRTARGLRDISTSVMMMTRGAESERQGFVLIEI